VNWRTGSGRAPVGVMRAVISSAPESLCALAPLTMEMAQSATPAVKMTAFLMPKS
jgi:hypothetical protein